jgi:hypothetical protein
LRSWVSRRRQLIGLFQQLTPFLHKLHSGVFQRSGAFIGSNERRDAGGVIQHRVRAIATRR